MNILPFLNEYELNGIINISNQLVYKNGYRDFENKKKITKNTIFPIGSVSKIFYATMVVILIDNGLIRSLNDKISLYLLSFSNKITILNCLLHTSGISEIRSNVNFNKKKIYNIDDLILQITDLKLFDPEQIGKYSYSTANYLIVGKICDILVGSSKKFLTNIFTPLLI